MVTEIKIQLMENGEVIVSAPFENQILALGLIEVAKDVIKDQAKAHKSGIIKPNMKLIE